MSFWNTEIGDITGDASSSFTNQIKQIPDNTYALAKIKKFAHKHFGADHTLEIEWELTDGPFAGQKVWQKLKCWDSVEKTRYRALNMLLLLFKLYEFNPPPARAPHDNELGIFLGKTAGIKIQETEPNDEGKQYNWVSEVHAAKGFQSKSGTSTAPTKRTPLKTEINYNNPPLASYEAEDIPF